MLRPSIIKMLFPLWGCLLIMGSCLQPKSGLRSVDHGEVFNLSGFAITPPSGPGWSLTSRNSRQITFTRETSASKFHTVMAFAELEIRAKDLKDLAELQGELLSDREYSGSRYRTLERRVSIDHRQGQEILRVDFQVEDRGVPYAPGKIFILTGQDLYLPHPDHPRWLLIKCSYSQRYLQGAAPLPVEREMESFLKSVVFTPLPHPERLRKPTPSQQAWLIKMDRQGEILWCRDYPEASGIGSLQPGKDGRIIAAGAWGGHYKTAGKPWVALLEPDGQILREHRFEGAGRDIPTALEAPDGGLVVIGEFLAEGNTGSYDVYLKKISPQGSEQWKMRYGWEGVESHNRAIPVRPGGCLVAGQCWSKGGPPRGWIFKVDSNGVQEWSTFLVKKKNQSAHSLAQVSDNGFVAALEFKFPDSGARLIKISAEGKEQWASSDRPINEPLVAVSEGGGIFFSGSFVPEGQPRDSNRSWAAWVEKMDSRGNTVWQRKYQGLYVKALAASADGGCLLAGWSTYYSPSTQTVAQVVKIDSSGNPQWVKSFEGAGGKTALSLLPTQDGGYLIGGRSEGGGF